MSRGGSNMAARLAPPPPPLPPASALCAQRGEQWRRRAARGVRRGLCANEAAAAAEAPLASPKFSAPEVAKRVHNVLGHRVGGAARLRRAVYLQRRPGGGGRVWGLGAGPSFRLRILQCLPPCPRPLPASSHQHCPSQTLPATHLIAIQALRLVHGQRRPHLVLLRRCRRCVLPLPARGVCWSGGWGHEEACPPLLSAMPRPRAQPDHPTLAASPLQPAGQGLIVFQRRHVDVAAAAAAAGVAACTRGTPRGLCLYVARRPGRARNAAARPWPAPNLSSPYRPAPACALSTHSAQRSLSLT